MTTPAITKTFNIALVGNPNAGKSSVFNRLTGLNQKVGNFPGVTVDRKMGQFRLPNGDKVLLTDLPGTYSLHPDSQDEAVVLEVLADTQHPAFPDMLVYIADINNLERHLLLLTQVMDLGFPVILGLNMVDVARQEGLSYNTQKIAKTLGIPVVELNGQTGEGLPQLKEAILNKGKDTYENFLDVTEIAPHIAAASIGLGNTYRDLLALHHAESMAFLPEEKKAQVAAWRKQNNFNSLRLQIDETMLRYEKFGPLLEDAVKPRSLETATLTDKVDRLLTHPKIGPIIFLLVLLLMFQAIFSWASYPMDWIESGFAGLSGALKTLLPAGYLADLLTDGILAGLGGVLVFIPQIAILFGLIAVLEEVGYMARVVFLFDRLMRRFGLNGRSIVSLVSGVACAIPAIMATRTISNWKERLITIMVTPLMSCSARIPVYTVLVAFVVSEDSSWGFLNLQGLVVFGLYLLGTLAAVLSAYVMKKVLHTREMSYFMLELPGYKLPYWKNIGLTMYEKAKTFTLEAGKVILVVSIVLWFLATFGPASQMAEAEAKARSEATARNLDEGATNDLVAAYQIEASYAGLMGKVIEPAIKPLGFDWKIGIALITSFAAREVFVGTMATIYSVGSSDDEQSVISRMQKEKDPITGRPVFDLPTSLSLLVFYVFAMQCVSTLAVVRRETKTWKWPLVQLGYMSALAYFSSLLVYQLLS